MKRYLKLAKIILAFAGLLFFAKPFLGFSIFNRIHQPAAQNIYVKAFAKRKLEERESKKVNTETIQKQLNDAALKFALRLSALLTILFPLVLLTCIQINQGFSRKRKLMFAPAKSSFILNCKLII